MTGGGAAGPVCIHPGHCPAELNHVDPLNTPLVDDEEVLVRAGYDRHVKNKDGVPAVQKDLINNKELRDAEGLSVWRLGRLANQSEAGIRAHMEAVRPAEPFRQAFGLTAGHLRSLPSGGLGRTISVLNDTSTGPGRPPDPAHAAIYVCRHHSKPADVLTFVKQALLKEFRDAAITPFFA